MILPLRVRSKIQFRHGTGRMTACWIWTGHTNKDGAGVTSDGSEPKMAHRYVYEKLRGPIPDGKQLRRVCSNADCVNPNHREVR